MSILDNALAWSGALRRQQQGNPEFVNWLEANAQVPLTRNLIDIWFEEFACATRERVILETDKCRKVLRQVRKRVFFLAMVRDLAGLASLEEITTAMTELADLAVSQAYRSIANDLTKIHGEPIDPTTGLPQEMLIVGMGKLGGQELNVSSDIDLIMLYGEEGETTGPNKISNHEFYVKLTRKMMPVISEADENGQVFRTDLRLRPDGDSGPLAWSLDAFEQYLFTQGREWERYAWLKARVIPAKIFEGSDSSNSLRMIESMRLPFVYRKYFDFDTLAALRSLRERIRLDWERRALAQNGLDVELNVKLGQGGIREVEFVVQLTQLIRGGRMASLRDRGLLEALNAQKLAGLMTPEATERLACAYRFLRRTEHALQYREDSQTHLLPQDPELRAGLAAAMRLPGELFWKTLAEHRAHVAALFKNAFRIAGLNDEVPESNAADTQDALLSIEKNIERAIAPYGDDAQELTKRVAIFLSSHRIRALSSNSKTKLDTVLPQAIEAASHTNHRLQTAYRTLDLLETIAQRSAYLALLAEYPETLTRITRMIAASPWAAQYLIQHPVVLDSLISWPTMMEAIDFVRIATNLNKDLNACVLANGQPDIEQQMNLMRDVQHQISFQLLAQDLEGVLSVEQLADQLSALADLMLEQALRCVWPLVVKPGQGSTPSEPKLAIIAYGKLGGKEFGYSSDLDLVYLYDDPRDEAAEQYAKLSRRLTSWLSTMTSSGRLYEVDLRLRPDGDAGLLAVSVQAFEQYELNHAWVWEHQAITRARFSAGDRQVGRRFEEIRRTILTLERDASSLKNDIIEMRKKITAGHPNSSPLFDIKHDEGGMVDLEFVTQYLVLLYARRYPELIKNLGNITLLQLASKYNLIDHELAITGANAYRALRHKQHILRLEGAEKARVPESELLSERESVRALWKTVFETS